MKILTYSYYFVKFKLYISILKVLRKVFFYKKLMQPKKRVLRSKYSLKKIISGLPLKLMFFLGKKYIKLYFR